MNPRVVCSFRILKILSVHRLAFLFCSFKIKDGIQLLNINEEGRQDGAETRLA